MMSPILHAWDSTLTFQSSFWKPRANLSLGPRAILSLGHVQNCLSGHVLWSCVRSCVLTNNMPQKMTNLQTRRQMYFESVATAALELVRSTGRHRPASRPAPSMEAAEGRCQSPSLSPHPCHAPLSVPTTSSAGHCARP